MASIIKVDTIQTAAGGTPTAADLGINTTGNVIQVVTFNYTGGEVGITSTSDASTPYTLNITPKFADSTILVMATFPLRKNTGTTDDGATISLYRDSTRVKDKWTFLWGYHLVSSSGMFGHFAGQYPDTPNTTSEITYTVKLRTSAGGDFRVGDSVSGGQLTAMEIAG